MVRAQRELPVGVDDGAGVDEVGDCGSRGVGLVIVVLGELVPGFVGRVGRTVRVGLGVVVVVVVGDPVVLGGVVGFTVVGGVVGPVRGGVVVVVVVGADVVGLEVRGGVVAEAVVDGAIREPVGRREEVDPGAGRRKIEEGESDDRTEDDETVVRSWGVPGRGGAVSSEVGVPAVSGAPGNGVWCWVATAGASKTSPLVT